MKNNERRRVVVTGLGVVAANAHGKENFSRALREGKSGIRRIPELEAMGFNCLVAAVPEKYEELTAGYLTDDQRLAMDSAMVYGVIAARDAFADAGLRIPPRSEDFVYEDTGAIIATGMGGLDHFSMKVHPAVTSGKVRRLGSTAVEQVMASSVSAAVGGQLALGNQVTTNSSACCSGTEAVLMGLDRIRAGRADRMLVGGAESSCAFGWAGFDSMRVLARRYNDTPEMASRPMSASADGFVPGCGAGVLVVEELETARRRGARIYAELLGGSVSCGGLRFGGTITAPSPRGVQRCVRAAVLDAGIQPADIDYINGHLTATMADPLEIRNWTEGLELTPKTLPLVNSTKSLIGHGLGAAGAIESVAVVLQLHEGFVHGSRNCEDLHPELNAYGESIVRETRAESIDVAAKAGFGFGDVNCCLIFRKWKE